MAVNRKERITMSKIQELNRCKECLYFDNFEDLCRHPLYPEKEHSRKIAYRFTMPDYCPLPSKPEPKEMTRKEIKDWFWKTDEPEWMNGVDTDLIVDYLEVFYKMLKEKGIVNG